jgi:hypothetical protein
MKLPKAFTKTLSVLAAGFCLVPFLWAQATTAPKAARKAKPATAQKSSAAKPSAISAATTAPTPEPVVGKRDPFNPLISERKDSAAAHLPPGKAGLVVATVRVDGTVRNGDGMMIAVLSNPEEHVYFAREGDHLYDGNVEKISLDGVTFRENSKDAFGKPVERVVTKRIYANAGAQQ